MPRLHLLPLTLTIGAVCLLNLALWRRDRQLAERVLAARGPIPALDRTPAVSVLVAAWGEGSAVDEHIRSFLALRYRPIELVICAGGPHETFERAARLAGPRVTVLQQLIGEGKQRALARCLTAARGEILYLTDADCRYDDAALLQLLAPLVNQGQLAATGSSRPLDEQLDSPLAWLLWAADLAFDARRGPQSDGMLGRNAALTRDALARIGGLDFAAPTGTDYHLAKQLLAAGVAIRFVPESVVATRYPERLSDYRRRRSRWLRNLLRYGPYYAAHADVSASRRTVAVGLALTALPLAGLRWRPLLALWALLVLHGCLARSRYALLAARITGRSLAPATLLRLPWLVVAEFAIWALAGFDALDSHRQERW